MHGAAHALAAVASPRWLAAVQVGHISPSCIGRCAG
jgi:hypothetical protein